MGLLRYPAACLAILLLAALRPGEAQNRPPAPLAVPAVPGKFVDVTEQLGIRFKHEASPTAKKYRLETMGSGVALFDFDKDGRPDVFLGNGARLDDPMAVGAVLRKDSSKY